MSRALSSIDLDITRRRKPRNSSEVDLLAPTTPQTNNVPVGALPKPLKPLAPVDPTLNDPQSAANRKMRRTGIAIRNTGIASQARGGRMGDQRQIGQAMIDRSFGREEAQLDQSQFNTNAAGQDPLVGVMTSVLMDKASKDAASNAFGLKAAGDAQLQQSVMSFLQQTNTDRAKSETDANQLAFDRANAIRTDTTIQRGQDVTRDVGFFKNQEEANNAQRIKDEKDARDAKAKVKVKKAADKEAAIAAAKKTSHAISLLDSVISRGKVKEQFNESQFSAAKARFSRLDPDVAEAFARDLSEEISSSGDISFTRTKEDALKMGNGRYILNDFSIIRIQTVEGKKTVTIISDPIEELQ